MTLKSSHIIEKTAINEHKNMSAQPLDQNILLHSKQEQKVHGSHIFTLPLPGLRASDKMHTLPFCVRKHARERVMLNK